MRCATGSPHAAKSTRPGCSEMTSPPPQPPVSEGATAPQHVHPLTPLVQAFRFTPAFAIAIVFAGGGNFSALGIWAIPLILIGIILLGLIVAFFTYLGWTRLWYYFDDSGDFRIDSGVLQKRERRLQLSRLQSVDITQPLVARLVNMASVRIEVAGAGDSRALVEFLTVPEAERLRAEVLARAAGLRPDTPTAPEKKAMEVDTGTLVKSLLLRGSTIMTVVITVAVVALIVATAGVFGLFGLAFAVFIPAVAVFSEFASYYGFTIAKSPDGLRTRAGLLNTRAQTIPPGRVHAVEFRQSILWRKYGWVRVSLNIAGVGGSSDDGSGSNNNSTAAQNVLIPVATRQEAYALVREIMPELDIPSIQLQPAPSQAHRRAWIQHADLAYGYDDHVFVVQRGRFVRRIAAIPHARVQSVRVTQGPWQRSLGLATMHCDSVPGPVSIAALQRDAGEARRIAEEEVDRLHRALAASGPDRWMRGRPQQAGDGAIDAPPPSGAPADLPPPTGSPVEPPPAVAPTDLPPPTGSPTDLPPPTDR